MELMERHLELDITILYIFFRHVYYVGNFHTSSILRSSPACNISALHYTALLSQFKITVDKIDPCGAIPLSWVLQPITLLSGWVYEITLL